MLRLALAIACVLPLAAAPARAQLVTLLEQQRVLVAEDALNPANTTIEIAPDAGPWSARARATIMPPGQPASLRILAAQQSLIGPDSLAASGSVSVNEASSAPVNSIASVNARALYRVRFELLEPAAYTLSGMLTAELEDSASLPEQWSADVAVALSPIDGGMLFDLGAALTNTRDAEALPLSATGELAPGVYEFTLTANAHQTFVTYAGAADARADYFVYMELHSLAPPSLCPADVNGDGVVNASDLALLLSFWGACP